MDRLFAGTVQLAAALPTLVAAAERTLDLAGEDAAAKRAHTLWRVDAGGGSLEDSTAVLARGYAVHATDYSGHRAQALAATVTDWIADPRVPGRQIGGSLSRPTPMSAPCDAARCAPARRTASGAWAS